MQWPKVYNKRNLMQLCSHIPLTESGRKLSFLRMAKITALSDIGMIHSITSESLRFTSELYLDCRFYIISKVFPKKIKEENDIL